MDFKTAYGPKQKVALAFPEEEGPHGRTKQEFRKESDINHIMERYKKTGVLNYTARFQPRYGDVTAIDFQDAMQKVATAKTMFNSLPAHIRDRFENDPKRFLEFVQDDRNQAEAIELGLVRRPPAGEAVPEYADQPPQEERLEARGEAKVSPQGGDTEDAPRAAVRGPKAPPKGGERKGG